MVEALVKVGRLLRNTFFLKEPAVHATPIALMGAKRFALFALHLAVPYWYIARALLLRACRDKRKSTAAMIESGFFHPALRLLSPEERAQVNEVYAALKGRQKPEPENPVSLADGYKKLGKLVSPEACESVVAYLKREKGFLSQVPMQSNGQLYRYDEAMQRTARQGRYFSFAPSTALKNPIIRGLADHPQVRETVRVNLGDNAVLNSINTFIVFPGEAVDHYVMRMHRDYDDFNFIAFFVYWTQVTADNGATVYVPGTHLHSGSALSEHKVFLEGTPGDVFALDSFGYHSGNSNVKTPRFVTWLRFGLEYNLSVADGWPLSQVERLMR